MIEKKNIEIESLEQGIIRVCSLLDWANGFIFDRTSQEFSVGTIRFYAVKINKFVKYCTGHGLQGMDEITPQLIREYLVWLQNDGHTPGGVHAYYRALKTFLKWYEDEQDGDWINPINRARMKAPKADLLEPADEKAIEKMTAIAKMRDRAILLCLLDTGARGEEFVSLNFDDVNQITGIVKILHGKGGGFRIVYIGKKTRTALRKYVKTRSDNNFAVFVGDEGERLTYWGLRQILRRLSEKANVAYQSPHSFRRLCAITIYRQSGDIYAVQRYMGHKSIETTKRYLRITEADNLLFAIRGSPVDKLMSH